MWRRITHAMVEMRTHQSADNTSKRRHRRHEISRWKPTNNQWNSNTHFRFIDRIARKSSTIYNKQTVEYTDYTINSDPIPEKILIQNFSLFTDKCVRALTPFGGFIQIKHPILFKHIHRFYTLKSRNLSPFHIITNTLTPTRTRNMPVNTVLIEGVHRFLNFIFFRHWARRIVDGMVAISIIFASKIHSSFNSKDRWSKKLLNVHKLKLLSTFHSIAICFYRSSSLLSYWVLYDR